MTAFMAVLALALLAVPGMLFLTLVTRRDGRNHLAMVVGYGLMAGLLGGGVLMRLLDALSVSLTFATIGTAALALILLLAYLLYRERLKSPRSSASTVQLYGPSAPLGHIDRLIVVLLLAIIVLRIALLAVDVALRPVFPWDATMHWATKARVWFEHSQLHPFVENADWLRSTAENTFTDHHPGYPITIPLLQLWMVTALGEWHESLMNLPWILCAVALAAAFYAQAREAGANVLLALTFTYFLMSMPLLNTQVALAGYADVFLGACYAMALMAFHNWSLSRSRSQGLLALLFALSCTLIKNEGFFWLLTFVPALLVVLIPGRRAVMGLGAMTLAAVVVLLVFPRDLVVAGHSLNELKVFYRPQAVGPILDSLFVYDSWHLFAWLLCGLLALVTLLRREAFVPLRGIGIALAAATLLFLFLFLFTAYSGGALRLTAVSRISLQLVPAMMFFALLLARSLALPPKPCTPAWQARHPEH